MAHEEQDTGAGRSGSALERGVGRPVPKRTELRVLEDPVADALDDMAALGLHWTRNRERGRMPAGIRAAMLLVAREVLAQENAAQRAAAAEFADLCGPTAYARNHGTVRVCPEKDHECGNREANWCAACPNRSTA